MDLTAASGDRLALSTASAPSLAVDIRDGQRPSAAITSGAARTTTQDTVFLTVSVADTRQTYTYAMPDDSVLAAALRSITSSPSTSVASQGAALPAASASLLRDR